MQTKICKQFDFQRITKQKLRLPIKFTLEKLRFPIKIGLKKLRFPIKPCFYRVISAMMIAAATDALSDSVTLSFLRGMLTAWVIHLVKRPISWISKDLGTNKMKCEKLSKLLHFQKMQ